MALLSGCVVADPPQYQEPARTPPIFDLAVATPLLGDVIVIDRSNKPGANDTLKFTIPVRSDDQGDPLRAALWTDFSFPTAKFRRLDIITESTIDDLKRAVELEWQVDFSVTAGCHPVTIIASHLSNWNEEDARPELPKARYDMAMATWFMNVDPEPGASTTLQKCPSHTEFESK